MDVQRFVAPTLREALAKVKETLGENALILKSERVTPGGSLSFLKRELVEVTAALADEAQQDLIRGPEFARTLDKELSPNMPPNPGPVPPADISLLRDEIAGLRAELNQIGKHIKYNNLPNLPVELTHIWESMEAAGMNAEWATDLTQEALIRLGSEELQSAQEVENYLIHQIAEVIKPAPQNTIRRHAAQRIVLVGSPGAGKTTLLQKLASDPVAYGKRKVGLLSLDTHRMAAIEQIRSFSRIAGTPLEIVFQPSHLAGALSRLSDCEVILVDTAGYSPQDNERMQNLKVFLDEMDPDENHLVLNSCIRDEEMIFACYKFRELGITHLSFTRLDESLRRGYLLNVVRSGAKPVGWISRGQGFTGYLHRFTSQLLREWIAHQNELPDEIKSVATV